MRNPPLASFIKDEPDTNESRLIQDIARLQKTSFDRRVKALGLTRSQWQAISALRHNPGIKQSELAELLDVEPITAGRLIDRLEEAGWIERRADVKDRRAKRLYLTKRVQGVVGEMRSLALDMRRELLAGVTQKDHRSLLQILKKIKTNLCDMD